MDGDEKILLRALGAKLIGFRRRPDGEMDGTGLLNPLLRTLEIVPIMALQSQFYYRYRNLARWRGKAVSNTFAPPNMSGPQWRTFRNMIWSWLSGVYRPVAVNFAVTYRCQGACPHCSAAFFRHQDRPELSTSEAKRVIDEVIDLGGSIIGFTGGEPLCRKDIYDLIAHVDRRKAVAFLFSNGQLLDDTAIQKLADAGLYCAYLSVDSPDPDEHDRGRGIPGLFAQNAAAIAKLRDQGILAAASSFATRTATARGDYRKIHSVARALGFLNLVLLDYIPTGRALKNTDEMLTPAQRDEIAAFAVSVYNKREVPPLSAQAWQNSIEGYLGGIGCFAGCREIYVTASGDVTPCDFMPLSFGNVREEPLARIWQRIRAHPSFQRRTQACKMQNPLFRKIFIDAIPEGAPLPYPIARLPRIDYKAAAGTI